MLVKSFLQRKFIVVNNEVKVKMSVLEDRRLDYANQKQVINFEIGQDDFFFKNPKQSVKVVLIKNNDFSNGIYDLKPQYNQGNTLIYRYNDESSFWGGNEYRNFDTKDIRLGTSQIRRVELTDIYNSNLFKDYDRSTENILTIQILTVAFYSMSLMLISLIRKLITREFILNYKQIKI